MIEILSDYYSKGDNLSGIFHCFSGDQELADRALELGFYISFSGSVGECTFRDSNSQGEIMMGFSGDATPPLSTKSDANNINREKSFPCTEYPRAVISNASRPTPKGKVQM